MSEEREFVVDRRELLGGMTLVAASVAGFQLLSGGSEKKRRFTISYRWRNIVEGFALPVTLYIRNHPQRIFPTSEWQEVNEKKGNERQLRFEQESALFELKKVK